MGIESKPDYYPLPRHNSQRGEFAAELYNHMVEDKNIWLVVGDLGYKVFDAHLMAFPHRTVNTGAAEQAMMGIGVGLALEGKKPFVYSISTFLLTRPFETIRNYINHEQIPVRLVGSGRDRDYAHDGFSHWSEDDGKIMSLFSNITPAWPNDKLEIGGIVDEMVKVNKPWYLNLRR